jgi:hypothetical protein
MLSGAMFLFGTLSASAHIGYNGRDFGTIVPNAAPVTVSNQAVTSNFGWADGTDDDFGDSHKLRYYRFNLAAPAYVTITFAGSTNGGTRNGSINPGFSVFQGLAHLAPITNPPGSADYDSSAITQAYLTSLGGVPKEGAFRALSDWRVGGDNQTGPVFDFDAADGLSTFVFKGYAADGDASLFGPVPGVTGDGNADGTVTKSFYLPAGDFSVFVGGVNYAGQLPTPDATSYGLVGTISASGSYIAGDPAAGGIGYQHQLILSPKTAVSFSGHVGAWSWEDNALFDAGAGEPPVGWTHTSNWAAVRLEKDSVLSVTMTRDANVPWPTGAAPLRRADTSSMFPSLTLYRGWDNDGVDDHTYNNRGNIDWAEDVEYVDHVDNSTEETITRTWFLPAGDYSFALGSNAPATNTNRQGYSITFNVLTHGATDPVPNTYEPPDYVGTGGIGYQHTIVAGRMESGQFSGLVGAWSWEDNALFDAANGEPPVGWTHTSNWVALRLETETIFTITLDRDATVPDPTLSEPNRLADTSSFFPSFTIYRGWDNDGSDDHTYNNRGNVSWAEDITYHAHVDNSTATTITRSYVLPAGDYSIAVGSNAPANNPNGQGYKLSYRTGPVERADPVVPVGGIGYTFTVLAGAGETGAFSSHVGSWSWEDNALFAPGQPPVGWTHTSNWLAVKLEEEVFFTVTMERDATVAWPSVGDPSRVASTSSMFPSLTLYQGWDNTGTDSHTYNNRGNISWAEGVRYIDHVENSTQTSITRTWRLPRGQYSLALGSNAPATNPDRQGYKLTYATVAAAPVITGDPVPGGVGYTWVVTAGAGQSGSVANHVGAWSWEDNSLFGGSNQGTAPVGWTHTSNWLGLNVTEPLTFTMTMSRNANVPWLTAPTELNGLADVSSMFPSLTLWRGWHNNGADSHTYNNRGPVAWAPGLTYMDHLDNSTAETVTRSWTLQPGQYTFALGSNAAATDSDRQGYTFAWTTSAPSWGVAPVITQHPSPVMVVSGRRFALSARFTGPAGTQLQWMKDGKPVPGATGPTLSVPVSDLDDAGAYQLEVRTASMWVLSQPARVTVLTQPDLAAPLVFPAGLIGQPYLFTLPTVIGTGYDIKGLPRGLRYDQRLGVIAGVPLVSGGVPVTVVMVNAAGRSAAQISTLTIAAMPIGSVATFTGPLGREGGLNDMLGGCVTVTTTSLGAFSVQLKLGQATFRHSARLIDAAGDASQMTGSATVVRRGRTSLAFNFTYWSAHKTLQGTVSDGAVTLPFTARPPAEVPAPFAGDYSFAGDPGATTPATAPQGFSVGALRVEASGLLVGALRLADDTPVTFAGRVESGGHLTIYNLLYRGTGSLLGVLSMQSTAEGDLRLSELNWLKKSQDARSRDRLYKSGFGPLNLEVFGRKYDVTKTPLELLGLRVNAAGNTALSFDGGGAPNPAIRLNVAAVEIPAGPVAQARMESANPAAVSLTVLRPTSGGGGAGKATFKEFTVTKGSARQTQGASFGEFMLEDVEGGIGLTGVTRRRKAAMFGTIVDDGSGPQLVGYFLLPELPALGAPASAESLTPIRSGRWMSE